MKGVFDLRSPEDLLRKLEWEFGQLIGDPCNAYLAYNFFVTGWHLLDWKYPGGPRSAEAKVRQKIRDDEPLLQICEHLAVGAKHFDKLGPQHQSVADSKQVHLAKWESGWDGKVSSWDEDWVPLWVVYLEGDAKKRYGACISIAVLAEKVMEYWRREM